MARFPSTVLIMLLYKILQKLLRGKNMPSNMPERGFSMLLFLFEGKPSSTNSLTEAQ